jgi:CRISPR-associated endoribonuclease cas2
MEKYKIMRMLCMFDLPVETEEQRRAYRIFRKNLIQEGFVMIQYSIYVRICPSREYANRLENRIKKGIPQEGNVRLLCVTEKQYVDMKLLVGSRQTAETAIGTERLIII